MSCTTKLKNTKNRNTYAPFISLSRAAIFSFRPPCAVLSACRCPICSCSSTRTRVTSATFSCSFPASSFGSKTHDALKELKLNLKRTASLCWSQYLLQLVDPAAERVHLDALLSHSGVQLSDGLFLLGAVVLRFISRLTNRSQLLLQAAQVLLLQRERAEDLAALTDNTAGSDVVTIQQVWHTSSSRTWARTFPSSSSA